MAEFVDNNNELENAVLKLINKEYPLTQENIAEELVIDLKNALCDKNFGKNFPITENNHTILKEKGEGINNLYRLKHFIEKFCNASGEETCELGDIKRVVNELPSNDEGIEDDINELMDQLNLSGGGGKKKKKMKGGTPEQLQQLLKLVHKGTILVQNSANQVIEGIDQTLVQIFTIANYVIHDFDAFEALTCVRLFMSTLIGEKLSKILESILIGAGAVGATMVGFQNSPKLLQYAPTILKYVATGGVVLTSSTVCFYIGDYVTNLSTLATNKYEKLTEDGKALINDLAEKVEKSQEGKVESATENIEKYNATVAELADRIKTLPPQDLIVLTTIENTDGEKESSMDVVPTENADGNENTENADGNENTENADGDAVDGDGDAVYGEEGDNRKRERDGDGDGDTDVKKSKATKLEEKETIDGMNQEETGGKKKKKGRTTQKKKKGTKGKKKASKSKKSKTKKNRKTKKKSNKK